MKHLDFDNLGIIKIMYLSEKIGKSRYIYIDTIDNTFHCGITENRYFDGWILAKLKTIKKLKEICIENGYKEV